MYVSPARLPHFWIVLNFHWSVSVIVRVIYKHPMDLASIISLIISVITIHHYLRSSFPYKDSVCPNKSCTTIYPSNLYHEPCTTLVLGPPPSPFSVQHFQLQGQFWINNISYQACRRARHLLYVLGCYRCQTLPHLNIFAGLRAHNVSKQTLFSSPFTNLYIFIVHSSSSRSPHLLRWVVGRL